MERRVEGGRRTLSAGRVRERRSVGCVEEGTGRMIVGEDDLGVVGMARVVKGRDGSWVLRLAIEMVRVQVATTRDP